MSNPAPIGHNRTPFEEISDEINDLYDEAIGWLDGEPINSQPIADGVEKLLGMIKASVRKAESLRKDEVKPLDEQKTAIQDKFNPLIGNTTKITGKAVLATKACQDALTPWKQKLQAEREAQAAELRRIAEEKQKAAQEAMQNASLEKRQEAEALAEDARKTTAAANRASKDKIKGMVTKWEIEVIDGTALLKHYWNTCQEDLIAWATDKANKDVSAGKRTIPGCKITSRKVAR